MIDLYLRADTEQELIDALPFARGLSEEGAAIWLPTGDDFNLDIIGDLFNEEETQLPGFHANLRCTQAIADLVSSDIIIIPPPSNLRRVWA